MAPRTAGYAGAALLCLAVGILLLWAAMTTHPALRVPPVIAYLAALVFVLAGIRMLHLHFGPGSEGHGFAALIATAFAGIGGWIAVGPGTRICGVGSGQDALAPLKVWRAEYPLAWAR